MGWHILVGRGETSSALVKYLSNRAFHSREWRRETAVGGSSSKGTRRPATPRSAASPLSLSVRYSREGGRGRRPQRGPIAVLLPPLGRRFKYVSMSRGNSQRKKMPFENFDLCYYRPPPLSPLPAYRFFCFTTLRGPFFLSIPVFRRNCRRLIRALPHDPALIKPIKNYRNRDAINYIRNLQLRKISSRRLKLS